MFIRGNIIRKGWLLGLLCTLSWGAIAAEATPGVSLDLNSQQYPTAVKAPSTHLVMTLVVKLKPKVVVGPSDVGIRQYIPIVGGYFKGEGIHGEVLPGGADWQLLRPDHAVDVDALYSIRTDDQQTIIVHNQGIATQLDNGSFYMRTRPQFQAPQGKYAWLNQREFVGTITPVANADAVVIRVYQVE